MHSHELVVVHALGLKTRSKNKVITDAFEVGRQLRDKVKTLLSTVMNKKSKKRYQTYKKYCLDNLRWETNRFVIPNDTRMSGVVLMFESALRSKKCLSMYTLNSRDAGLYEAMVLKDEDWMAINEFYSILIMTRQLTISCQSDAVDNNCFAYFHVAQIRHYLRTKKVFSILNFDKSWSPTEDITSKKLLVPAKRDDLLDISKILIERLITEYDRYFKCPDSDLVMMMVLHPLFVWEGLRCVYLFLSSNLF